MTPEQEAAIQSHVHSIAEILYKATPAQQLETLEGIEATIRKHLLEQVGPELTLFYPKPHWHNERTETATKKLCGKLPY
ncbi:MAG: hypothetical protein HC773_22980 [Scytonema sp. CRU_2_7]|nr:hypothetical protein [Scytonema sp. CRU_2_7]